ncbi:MAG: hypothetical protein LBF36_01450 [Mycoplasmataceae bacterium]|nr:hypothetical protein [Mycoplasmataceae bacterium]
MEFVDQKKQKEEIGHWHILNANQKRLVYLGMIIGMLIAVIGVTFLSLGYSIIVGCVLAGIAVLALIAVSIIWLLWIHRIRKKN